MCRPWPLALLLTLAPLSAAPAQFEPPVPRPAPASVQTAFEGQVARLEQAIGGRIGIAVRLVETGESAAVHADEHFPMASTFKVAIAGTLLARVDRGEVSLDQLVPVTQRDMDETGEVADHLIHPGVSLSVANLVELMLTQSNNTATDKVLAVAGGPAAVTAWLHRSGIEGLTVDRTVNDLLNDFVGFPHGAAFTKEYERRWPTPEAQEQADKERTPNPAFERDQRDTATPPAMVDLLARLLTGSLLNDGSRTFLIGVMERCETGKARLKGLLPDGTVIAHKTGTIGGTVNDVGMITLPGGRGHLLIAVFTKASAKPEEARERAIAELGRTAFDYFAAR